MDDMDLMEEVGIFEGVAVHEMGHAVGIGYVIQLDSVSLPNPFDGPNFVIIGGKSKLI